MMLQLIDQMFLLSSPGLINLNFPLPFLDGIIKTSPEPVYQGTCSFDSNSQTNVLKELEHLKISALLMLLGMDWRDFFPPKNA